MPLYEYQCDTCGHRFELIQKYSDPPPEACPACGGTVSKLFSSPAIQFKGSGFYLTDYGRSGKTDAGAESADKAAEKSASATKGDGGAESKASESKTESKVESKAESKSEPKSDTTSVKPDSKVEKKADTKPSGSSPTSG